MTSSSKAGVSPGTVPKRVRTTEGFLLPSEEEIEAGTSRELRGWCKQLGLQCRKRAAHADLQEALKDYVANSRRDKGGEQDLVSPKKPSQKPEPALRKKEVRPMSQPSTQAQYPKYLKALRTAATYLAKVGTDGEQSEGNKEKVELILEGLIGGLELAERDAGYAFSAYSKATGSPDTSNSSAEDNSWRNVVKRGHMARPAGRQFPVPTGAEKAHKAEVRRKLIHMAGIAPDPRLQGIWEPEMENYRKMDIPELRFKTEVEKTLLNEFGVENGVQTCRRLERGGFKLQLSATAFSNLSGTHGMKLVTEQHGTWIKSDPIDPAKANPSIVAEGIDQSVSDDKILEELAVKNTKLHGKSEKFVREAVTKIERLKRRNKESGKLEPTRSVRIFGQKELLDELIKVEGFILGGRPCFCRPYARPVYTCYQCQRVGHHRFSECRFPPKCRHCNGTHLTNECLVALKTTKAPEKEYKSWEDIVQEETRDRKTTLKGPTNKCQ